MYHYNWYVDTQAHTQCRGLHLCGKMGTVKIFLFRQNILVPIKYIDPNGEDPEEFPMLQCHVNYLEPEASETLFKTAMVGFGATIVSLAAIEASPYVIAYLLRATPTATRLTEEVLKEAETGGAGLLSSEMNAAKNVINLSRSQLGRISKIKEIAHNWEVRKTLSGEILDSGHITKIKEGIVGLIKHRRSLQNSLNNSKLNSATRNAIQGSIDTATDLIERGKKLIE